MTTIEKCMKLGYKINERQIIAYSKYFSLVINKDDQTYDRVISLHVV